MKEKETSLRKQFASEIENVAQHLAKDLNPIKLRERGEHEAAQTLGFAIDLLNENELMGAVENRVAEIKRLEEMRKLHKKPAPRRKSVKKPLQRHLSSAHPEGYRGLMRLPDTEEDRDSAFDPERNIMEMHHEGKRGKILDKDVAHWWRQKLKEWGFTQANRSKRLQITARETIFRLKEAGVWHLVEKSDLTEQDLMYIRAAVLSRSPFDEV